MDECIPCHVRRKHKPKPYTIFSKPRGERGRLLFLSAPRFFLFNPSGDGCKKQKPKSVGAQMCSNKRGEEVAIFDSSIKLEPLKRSCVSLPIIILLSTFWDVFQFYESQTSLYSSNLFMESSGWLVFFFDEFDWPRTGLSSSTIHWQIFVVTATWPRLVLWISRWQLYCVRDEKASFFNPCLECFEFILQLG